MALSRSGRHGDDGDIQLDQPVGGHHRGGVEMSVMPLTPREVRHARARLGLSLAELAEMLGLNGANAADTVRAWEAPISDRRAREISGPASLVIIALLDGWKPPPRDRWSRLIDG